MSAEPLLRVDGLAKYFPVTSGVFGREVASVKAVDGVSFELRERRTLGLVGESGCGKTTVGESIVRLLEPTAGRILFDGRDITHTPQKELRSLRRDLQIIFQDPFGSLNPRMTVVDIVGEAVEAHGLASGADLERRVLDTFAKVGIPAAWINRYPHEFSGGQRQRISIARAIALEPRLVVCDEAVSALDVSIQAQVINLLIDLQREMDLAYLFISHDLSVVRHIADDIAVMYLGQIVESAGAGELFAKPAHPYARSLLSAIPVIDPRLRSERIVLEGDVPTPLDPPSGCRFHTRCPAAFERCRSEEPPAIAVGALSTDASDPEARHRVKCWHADALGDDPEWFAQVRARSDAAMAELRGKRPASRFALVEKGGAPPLGTSGASAAAKGDRVGASGGGEARGSEDVFRSRADVAASRATVAARALDVVALRAPAGFAGVAAGAFLVLAGWPLCGTSLAGLAFAVGVLPGRRPALAWTAALVALLLLCGQVASRIEARALTRQAASQLAALEREIEAQLAHRGAPPTRLADLGWRLPAIVPDGAPADPWGGRWLYRVPGAEGRSYDLGSYGPDARLGGGDDLGFPFSLDAAEGERGSGRASGGG